MTKAGTILLFISAAILIIGIHQTIINGFEMSYWIFMISLSLFFLYRLIKQQDADKKTSGSGSKKDKGKSRRNRGPQGNRQIKRYMKRTR
jgi:hypothetical protein